MSFPATGGDRDEDERPESVDPDEFLSELDQTHSDADQTASDNDEVASGRDSGASQSDRQGAERDQRASDADQSASDRDLSDDPTARQQERHDDSEHERGRSTDARDESERAREDAERDRGEQHTARLETGELRGDVADERDRAAVIYDGARQRSEDSLRAAHPDNTRLHEALDASAALRDQVAEQRVKAAADRHAAAGERTSSAVDRLAAREAIIAATPATRDPRRQQSDQAAAARISTRIVGLHKEHRGRGPQSVHVTVAGEVVTVVMRYGYSTVETELKAGGNSGAVDDQRDAYEDIMKPRLIAVVAEELGRPVDAFMSGSNHDPDLTIEVFVLKRLGQSQRPL